MIERGSGRTSGLTDWHLMNVPSMWACLQDQDTTNQWRQVAGWGKVCDLAKMHLSRLQEYRRGLAEAWPPETNSAARAYLGELDQLIERVQRTHDAAAANYSALSAATHAIASSRGELRKVYDEYVTKSRQKQAYEEIVADPKAVAGSRLPERPPVTDADLTRLDAQARTIMYGLSGELQHAQVMLQKPPPPPRKNPGADQANSDVYTPGIAPIIPPIVPVPVKTVGGSGQIKSPSTTTRPVTMPTAPAAGPVLGGPASGTPTPSPGTGPVLGGVGGGLAPPPTTPPLAATPSPPAPPGPTIGLPPTMPPSAISGRGGTSQPGTVGRPIGGNVNGAPHAVPPSTPRAMPPGGLIGGVPGMGLGQPAASAVPPRRVNPIGGVIGGGGAGTAPTGGAGSRPGLGRSSQFSAGHGMPPAGGLPGRRERHEPDGTESRRWDPDHPWETEQGVAPVVRPPDEEGPIDPGPAIGLNR
nr:hypothetical protein [Micromonospora rosaria]